MEILTTLLNQKYTITGLVVLLSGYLLLRRNPRVKYHLNKLTGPGTVPVLGNALQLLRPHNEVVDTFGSWFQEYGTTCRFWVGNFIPYALTCDVNVIEKLISTTNYIEKGKHDYSVLLDWLGTGLLTAPGYKWFIRRKLLTPSFHFKILEDFIPVFNEQASILVDCLEKRSLDNEKPFDMNPYITKCTLDIICETAMGKKINAQTSTSNKQYFDALNGMCSLMLDKVLKPWLRVPFLYYFTSKYKNEKYYLKVLKGFTQEVIQTRKAERKLKQVNSMQREPLDADVDNLGVYGRQRKAFLDLMLDVADETGQLNDDDIREEVDTFMFEGQDTTGVNLAWTVLLLAIHPERQRLVHVELDEIFAGDATRDITSIDISKMKYLECCLKESLRLFPSVPFIMRQIDTDLSLADGRIVPTGATVMISIFHVHRRAEHFTEPDKFIPERWSAESSGTKRHPYAYIPFSAGGRNCIGQKFAMMEEKIVLAKLFRRFTIETTEKLENLRKIPDVVLRCENGVHVTLRKRC